MTMTIGVIEQIRQKGEDQLLKLIRATTDLYEAFKDDDFYIKLKKMLWQKYSGDYIKGMQYMQQENVVYFVAYIWFRFYGIASSITEV